MKRDDVQSDSPWFPFYASDWLSDQDVMLMNSDERGQYIQLLANCWNDKDCSIPDNGTAIGLLCGCHIANDKVLSKFVKHPYKKNALTNSRLMAERVEQVAFKKSKSRAGAKGARVRWKSQADGTAIDVPIANGMANDSPSPSPSPSPSNNPLVGPKKKDQRQAGKNGQPKKKTNPEIKICIDYYHDKFLERFSNKPIIDGGDAKLLLPYEAQQQVERAFKDR